MRNSDELVIVRDLAIEKTEELLTTETRRRGVKTDGARHLKSIWSGIQAVVREIFDESAYERFLQRTKVAHSAESYRAFQREREDTIAQKPRCC
jgi:hypothetical protein